MNTVRMYLLLSRARKGLNLIIVGTYTMKAFGISALASGIFIIITRWLGWSSANFLTWLLFTCCGGLLGMAIGYALKRWDEAAVARWIDIRFEFQEAITAALICIERGCSGLLDQAIIERAQLVSAERLQIKWPLNRFYRQIIQTGLLIGVTVLALTLVPARLGFLYQNAGIPGQVKDRQGSQLGKTQEHSDTARLTPREIAKMLFPQDPKLMVQAENAIMAGDMDSLRDLLRHAASNLNPESLAQTSAATKQNLARDTQEHLMQSLISADNIEDVRRMMDQNQEQESKGSQGEAKQQKQTSQELAKRQSSNGSKQGKRQETYPRNPKENQNIDPNLLKNYGNYAYNSAMPGQGAGTKEVGAKINPQFDSSKKPIILANKGGFFEYLLPGKDTKVPLAGVLPGAAQASEQALFQQRAPGEYADYTRSYFLKLSRFITGGSPESGGKP